MVATPASDQFAFGVTLFQALYGKRPFEGANYSSYLKSLVGGPPRIPAGSKVPARLGAVVLRCLATSPEARFPSMDAVISALEHDPVKALRSLGYAVLAVLGAVAVGTLVWSSSRDPCPAQADLNASVWRKTSPREIRDRLIKPHPSYTPRIDRTMTMVDQSTQTWAQQARRSCQNLRRANPAPIDIQREACLQRQRQALTVLVDALAQADPSIVPHVDEVVENFLDGLGCERDEAILRVRPDDVPPHQKELASKLRAQLFHAQVLLEIQDIAQAQREAAVVAEAAHKAGLKGFESEAKIALGEAENLQGNSESAITYYQDAYSLAVQAGTDERAFHAGALLIRRIRDFRDRIAEARQVMITVEALFERLGRDPHMEMELLNTRSSIADAEGKPEQAIEYERQRLELAKKVSGARSRAVASAMESLAAYHWKNRNISEANILQDQKFEFYLELYGPNDPAVLTMVPMVVRGILAEGRAAAAMESLQASIIQSAAILSPDDETTPHLKLLLSQALEGIDEPRALALAEEVVTFHEGRRTKSALAEALAAKARSLVALGRANEATPICAKLDQITSGLTDPQGDYRRAVLICKASTLQKAAPNRAAALWEDALKVQPAAAPKERGAMAFALSQALAAIHAPKEKVRAHAQEALTAYATFKDFEPKAAEVTRWLQSQK